MKDFIGDEMKKIIFTIITIIVIVAVAITVMPNFDKNESDQENKIENLVYHYQDTYVGDNSSVGGILNNIFLSENIKYFRLGTSDAPYSITVNYELEEGIKSKKLSQYMEYNATALFALVKNVDIITFNIEDIVQKTYAFKRETIEVKYDEELSSYITDEKTWMKEVYLKVME
jgi:hypothetical protein